MSDYKRKRWYVFSVQMLLGLLLVVVPAYAVGAQSPAGDAFAIYDDSQTGSFSADPVGLVNVPSSASSATLLGYRITFNGVTYNPDGTSTWRYTVTPLGIATKALSHWTLGLCIPTYGVVSAGPGGYEVGTDPTTGVTGIKWETQIGPDDPAASFWFTISGWYQVAVVDVAVKAGQNVATGMVDGPSCDPVEPTPTPTNTPVTPTQTPTNTPVTPTQTPTNTPVTPTQTPTNTPVTPTQTPTNTPVTPTQTPTNTPVAPTRYIYGYVYLDGTSQGLADAIVELKVRWNGSWNSVGRYATRLDGFFEFYYNGPVEVFTLTETNPPGYESTWASKPYPQVEVLNADNFRHTDPPMGDLGAYIFYDTLGSGALVGSIGDYVWHDANWDGFQDEGESPLANITVLLKDAEGKLIGVRETDEHGLYLFSELEEDSYQVAVDAADEDLPYGFVPTTPTEMGVNLGLGEHFQDADFGFAAPCPVCPDWLVYHTDRDGNWELYLLSSEEGAEELNLTDDPGMDIAPSRAPDALWVAFQSDRNGNWDIFAVSSDGEQTIQLTSNPFDDVDANWSAECDVRRIAFQSNRDGNWEIYTVNLDGSGERRITVNDAADTDPSWSPECDSGKIAFQSDRAGNWDIYVVDAATGEETMLVGHPADDVDPSWSPDGRYITFLSNRDGNWEVYVLDVQLGTETRVTMSDGEEKNPAWSPDGNWIAYQSNRDGNWDIYVASPHSGQEIRVTSNPMADEGPTWDCGSSKIAFHSERDGNPEINLVSPFNNDGVVRLTENVANDMYPAWMPPEEDGTLMMRIFLGADSHHVYLPIVFQ